MRYIRFLKTPRFENTTIKALATVTSDLGDSFAHTTISLIPYISAINSTTNEVQHTYLQTRLWKPGMRAVPITWTPSAAVLALPGVRYVMTVIAVDERTGAKSLVNMLPGGGGGRRAEAEFPSVVGVVSAEFCRRFAAEDMCVRRFEVADGTQLSVWERCGDAIEGHIWDAGYATIGFLNHLLAARLRYQSGREFVQTEEPRRMERISVLELGCGTGLVGLFLAAIVPLCQVTLTDLPPAEELVKKNISKLTRPATESSAHFQALEWGLPLPEEVEQEHFDIILLSDVNYNPDNARALVTTIQHVQTSSPDVLVMVAAKKRHDTEDVFAQLMAENGYVSHNHFAIALPTDTNVSAPMWAGTNALEDVDLVNFTLYTKGQDMGDHGPLRRPAWATDHILADLWTKDKQWSSGSVKRRKSGKAKVIAKAKRKKHGEPYVYAT